MKARLPLIALAIALVAAAIWLLAPGGNTAAPTAGSAPPTTTGNSTTPVDSKPDRGPEKTARESTPIPREVSDQMVRTQRMKAEKEIARLVKLFDLSQEQENLLRAWYDERVNYLQSKLEGPEGMSRPVLDELAALMRGAGLEEALQDILTPAQREKLAQKQEADRHDRVEAYARKQLNQIARAVKPTAEQRRALYDQIYAEASARYDERTAESPYAALTTNGQSVRLQENFFDGSGSVEEPARDPSTFTNEERRDYLMSAWREYVLNDVLPRYQDILSPDQLASLQSSLEGQSSAVVQGEMTEPYDSRDWMKDPSELPLHQGLIRE